MTIPIDRKVIYCLDSNKLIIALDFLFPESKLP